MNKIVKAVGLVALAAIVVVSLASCDLGGLTSVSGKVVNAGTSYQSSKVTTDEYWSGTEGIVVNLVNSSGATVNSAVVNSTGDFSFSGVSRGSYTITGTKTGWAFVPTEIEVTGILTSLNKDLIAYMPENASQILLIVNWTNKAVDVDSHLVIDTDDDMTNGNSDVVYYAKRSNTTPVAGGVTLDRDIRYEDASDTEVTGYPLETIRLRSNPFGAGSGYAGYLRYYLKAYGYNGVTGTAATGTTAGVLTGDPTFTAFTGRANATVYIMQGNEHLGTYQLPINSAENTVGVIKVAVTYSAGTTTYDLMSFGNEGTTPKAISSGIVGVKEIK